MMTNEKPGGHGERSVAVGTIDMAVWTPGRQDGPVATNCSRSRIWQRPRQPKGVRHAAGGYHHQGQGSTAARGEMQGYLDPRLFGGSR